MAISSDSSSFVEQIQSFFGPSTDCIWDTFSVVAPPQKQWEETQKLSVSMLARQRHFRDQAAPESRNAWISISKKINLHPKLLFSISHSGAYSSEKSKSRVLLIAHDPTHSAKPLLGIGADFEPLSRPVTNSILERVSELSEFQFGLTNHQMWVLKEAAFKANPENKNTVLRDYKITGRDQVRFKQQTIQVKAFEWETFQIGLAKL